MRAMKRVLVLTVLAGTALQANTAIQAQTPNTAATIRQYQLERDSKAFRLVMKTVPRPAATASGQVLVRVRAVSLNQVALIGGLSGFAANVPVGQLMGIGASATGIYVGSRATSRR
jgi:hypothetical protein